MPTDDQPPIQLRALYEAILDAYPDYGSLERLVLFDCNVVLTHIAAVTLGQEDVVLKLLQNAKASGWLPRLVDAAIADRPENPRLAALVATLAASPKSRRELEREYLDYLNFNYLQNTEQYTELAGHAHFRADVAAADLRPVVMRPEFVLLSADREKPREVRRFENAVDEILKLRRAVVLGEPGAGKTTTLWKLARRLMDEAAADANAPLPILVRLGRWTKDTQPLSEFIAGEMGAFGAHLAALLKEKRAALLLDGLNEIPTTHRRDGVDNKDRQVRRFIAANAALTAVISCRARDYTLDLGFDRIEISPLDPTRILEFTTRYLGADHGEALFWRLAGDPGLKQVCDRWMAAGASFALFWEAKDIPRENPDIYSGTSVADDALWQKHVRDNPASLLEMARNPYMLWMLTQVYKANDWTLPDNRAGLFRSFALTLMARERVVAIDPDTMQPVINEEAVALLDSLALLAYEMQVERGQSDDGNAVTVLPVERARTVLTEQQMQRAGSCSMLNVGEQISFTHQLLQEYFAAVQMRAEIEAGRLTARSLWPQDSWWKRTNWEEATVLLAGLYAGDCTPVVEWLIEANPALAGECLVRGGAPPPAASAIWQKCRLLWIPRLTTDPHPQARVLIGRALAVAGLDNRPGVGLLANGVPDIVWCDVPAGEFLFGSDKNSDSDAYEEDEMPQMRVSLPAFRISRYPVTYRQFQAFIDAPDGYANPEWWNGLHEDGRTQQANGPGDQEFKYDNPPREHVSWYDAMAFCRWLTAKLGYEVRLPSEQEWEKAARGTDGLTYPYGSEFDAAKGNTSGSGIGQTSAVGAFSDGASPYGALDMSGNVWEWTLTEYYTRSDSNVRSNSPRGLRGGAWYIDQYVARSAARDSLDPDNRDNYVGFRLASPANPSGSLHSESEIP